MAQDRKALLLLAAVIVAGAGGLLLALSGIERPEQRAIASPAGTARAAAGHTLFHIGCTHHNHGPAWHARHGRSASYQRPLGTAGEAQPSGASLRSRALTAGR